MYKSARKLPNSEKQSGSAILWTLVWLAGMAALAYFCVLRHVPALELATENKLNQAITAESATNVTGTVNGYTATLRGNAQNDSQKQTLLTLAAATPGVKTVVDEITLNEVASSNEVASDTASPAASPAASNEAALTELADATAPAAEQNEISVARADDSTPVIGTPKTSTDTNSAVSDVAEPSDVAEATEAVTEVVIETEATAQPESTATTSATPTKEPSLKLDITDNTLLIEGDIATTDNLNSLVDQAKASLNIDQINNTTDRQEDTKPATWLEPVTALLPAMAALEKPGISIQTNQVTISGIAPDQQTHDALITRALQLVGDYSLIERIEVAEIKTAEADPTSIEKLVDTAAKTLTNTAATDTTDGITASLDPAAAARAAYDALPSKRILFNSNNATITAESQQVLNNIAQILRDHPDAEMDIDGHTDASGPAQANLLLSQERANAVRDYLVDQGISVYRLSAYGFGEGMPITENNTREGRAMNRRIEFKF